MTDDKKMKGLQDSLEQIVLKSYAAGCDVILHCMPDINLNSFQKILSLGEPLLKKRNTMKIFLMI